MRGNGAAADPLQHRQALGPGFNRLRHLARPMHRRDQPAGPAGQIDAVHQHGEPQQADGFGRFLLEVVWRLRGCVKPLRVDCLARRAHENMKCSTAPINRPWHPCPGQRSVQPGSQCHRCCLRLDAGIGPGDDPERGDARSCRQWVRVEGSGVVDFLGPGAPGGIEVELLKDVGPPGHRTAWQPASDDLGHRCQVRRHRRATPGSR